MRNCECQSKSPQPSQGAHRDQYGRPIAGDLVLYATGSSARQTELTKDKPCDAVTMAIVDSWDLGGENVYEKWS